MEIVKKVEEADYREYSLRVDNCLPPLGLFVGKALTNSYGCNIHIHIASSALLSPQDMRDLAALLVENADWLDRLDVEKSLGDLAEKLG